MMLLLTVKLSVTTESQPCAPVNVSTYVPEVVRSWPLKGYSSQAVAERLEVLAPNANCTVMIESQPAALGDGIDVCTGARPYLATRTRVREAGIRRKAAGRGLCGCQSPRYPVACRAVERKSTQRTIVATCIVGGRSDSGVHAVGDAFVELPVAAELGRRSAVFRVVIRQNLGCRPRRSVVAHFVDATREVVHVIDALPDHDRVERTRIGVDGERRLRILHAIDVERDLIVGARIDGGHMMPVAIIDGRRAAHAVAAHF